MSDLQSKSNFELNALIAIIENPDLSWALEESVKEHEDGSAEFWLSTPDGNDAHAGKYNYTGGWAQMGPIIEREKIVCEWNQHDGWGATHEDLSVYYQEETPLRAAAICFLQMKEAE